MFPLVFSLPGMKTCRPSSLPSARSANVPPAVKDVEGYGRSTRDNDGDVALRLRRAVVDVRVLLEFDGPVTCEWMRTRIRSDAHDVQSLCDCVMF
jgi:hypothetical protein